MVLALYRDHPLANHKSIHPAQLKSESFVNYSPELDVGFWKHIDIIGEAGNFTPRITARVKDAITVLSCVSAGQGVAVVSEAFKKVQMPNVVYRDFSIEPPMTPTSMIYRSDEPSPAAQAFIKFVRKHPISEKHPGSG
jgi:DNA-binding transcriptional LysR family regulator